MVAPHIFSCHIVEPHDKLRRACANSSYRSSKEFVVVSRLIFPRAAGPAAAVKNGRDGALCHDAAGPCTPPLGSVFTPQDAVAGDSFNALSPDGFTAVIRRRQKFVEIVKDQSSAIAGCTTSSPAIFPESRRPRTPVAKCVIAESSVADIGAGADGAESVNSTRSAWEIPGDASTCRTAAPPAWLPGELTPGQPPARRWLQCSVARGHPGNGFSYRRNTTTPAC